MSKLLPKDIQQVSQGVTEFTNSWARSWGCQVNTSNEPNLKIMITRDRLAETTAYEDLVKTVRYAFDWYANETAKAKNEEKKQEKSTEPTSLKFERVEQVLEAYESDISKESLQRYL